jgi:hypothetical protein
MLFEPSQRIVGVISLTGEFLVQAKEAALEQLARAQAEFGKAISAITGKTVSIYTVRENPQSTDISVKFVINKD